MRPYAGRKVLISFLSEPEPKVFAESLARSLNALGLSATKQESGRPVNQILTEDQGLGAILADWIGEATGRKPRTTTFNKALPDNSARAALGREFAVSGNFITFPDAGAYIEIGVRQAKRQ